VRHELGDEQERHMAMQARANVEPTFKEKAVFQLSVYANLITGRTGDDLEGILQQEIQRYLDANEKVIGRWEIVWGPGVKQYQTDLYAVNALYMARNVDDPSQYVIAIAGTNGTEPFSWLFENLLVQTIPWSPLRPFARLTMGASVGLNILKQIEPTGDRQGAGQTLRQFLKDLPDKNIDITVTGHSLGGVLAPVLALWLRDSQRTMADDATGWDFQERAKISTLSTGGPTPGNRRFSAYVTERLERVRRYSNDLDPAPKLWANATIGEARRFYDDHELTGPVPWMFDIAAMWSSGDFYQHIDPDTASFPGTFNAELVDPAQDGCVNYLNQALYQHEVAYQPFFDLDDLEWPVIRPENNAVIFTPGLRRLFEAAGRPLPRPLAEIAAGSRLVTLPIADTPVELPVDPDSPEAEELAQWVEAQLDDITEED
jgi:hypothetical protein